MLKEPYMEKFYTYHSKYIENILSLRPPQRESLEIFSRLCDVLSLSKTPDLYAELEAVHGLFPTLSSFERDFPSFCFALATGIGKTRLMGACIAYLRYEKSIKNFFVVAPNITIYDKLKKDLGDPSNKKYVFRGLDLFATPPRIIDGENYEDFRQTTVGTSDIIINVFNIAKLNSDSKGKDGKPARIKRLNEVLGQSYFDYLKSLPDLCIFMDESHHYHADKSFTVINELSPILGVELTATPQVQKGAKKEDFRNVVYEYSLAHALNDKMYVKVPTVFTRKDFHPEEYTPDQLDHEKLNDGLRLHEETKSRLEVYARNHGKPIIKPFVLVVARDTDHSKQLMEYIKSAEFFGGYYADKVMEINSDQKKGEKDENIRLLLELENPDNRIEIVIHVNMLKEGWDVTNLYTIIPLRASASETLTEQTIGRGLRLPYGDRTGDDDVDRLSIVSHDKYEAIIKLANEPDSLVRKVYYIDDTEIDRSGEKRETIELPTAYDAATSDSTFIEQLSVDLFNAVPQESKEETPKEIISTLTKCIVHCTKRTVIELNKQVKTFDAVHDESTRDFVKKTIADMVMPQFSNVKVSHETIESVIEKAIDTCVQALTDKVIPIPRSVIQPFTEVKQGFTEFDLDTRNMNWHPSGDALLGTELSEGGATLEVNPLSKASTQNDTPENEVARHIIVKDNVDYNTCADLIYSLIGQLRKHFLTYMSAEDADKVMHDRQHTIAEMIYGQMNDHFYHETVDFRAAAIRPFSRIETAYGDKFKSDEIFDLKASVPAGAVRSKVFGGFKKACHTLYKFDSGTERDFAIVLENDGTVLKWLRPASKQFDIYYGPAGSKRYEPDFIVETADKIYMIETKASNETEDDVVLQKARAAMKYCEAVTEWNAENGGKPWEYALIPHTEVRISSSLKYLISCKKNFNVEQLKAE